MRSANRPGTVGELGGVPQRGGARQVALNRALEPSRRQAIDRAKTDRRPHARRGRAALGGGTKGGNRSDFVAVEKRAHVAVFFTEARASLDLGSGERIAGGAVLDREIVQSLCLLFVRPLIRGRYPTHKAMRSAVSDFGTSIGASSVLLRRCLEGLARAMMLGGAHVLGPSPGGATTGKDDRQQHGSDLDDRPERA